MSLLLRTHLRLARESLRRSRSRSFLTCLGIAIGVASIILILSLMGSIENLVKTEVDAIGADLIVVRPESRKDITTNIIENLTSASTYRQSTLYLEDSQTIQEIDNIAAVAPIATLESKVEGDNDRSLPSVTILATLESFNAIQPVIMASGIFLSGTLQNNTVVIGHTLSYQLFGDTNVVGKTVSFLGQRFIIVGVLAETGDPINFNNVNLDTALIADAHHLADLGINFQIQQINIKAKNTNQIAETATEIEEKLEDAKSGDTNFSVSYGDQITHPAGSFFTIVTGILTLVAAISLVVGGIGVMNIMLVSVSERSHEIGIRRAVGASSSSIFFQFLFESLILSISGGLLGLVFAYALAFLVCLITPFNPFISWQIIATTFGTSLFVGVVFGLYPALKAARKSPIASLKSYR